MINGPLTDVVIRNDVIMKVEIPNSVACVTTVVRDCNQLVNVYCIFITATRIFDGGNERVIILNKNN